MDLNIQTLVCDNPEKGTTMFAQKSIADEITNPVDEALAYHGGDARLTIATFIADCEFLRGQLFSATSCMSRGLTRGWTPDFERRD